MRKWHALAGLAVAVAAGAFVTGSSAIRAQQQPIVGPDYLYIEEFEITRGMVPNDAIAEAKRRDCGGIGLGSGHAEHWRIQECQTLHSQQAGRHLRPDSRSFSLRAPIS
jgi:hypothetical protein